MPRSGVASFGAGRGPLRREAIEVRARPLPGSRRGHPDKVHPDAGPAEQGAVDIETPKYLGTRARAIGQEGTHAIGGDLDHPGVGGASRGREPPCAAALPDARGEKVIVAGRDHVDGRSHEGSLHHAASLKQSVEVVATELGESGPEPEVTRGRVLGLEPAEPLDRARDRHLDAFQQQLAGQKRPVQLPLGEGPLEPPGESTDASVHPPLQGQIRAPIPVR